MRYRLWLGVLVLCGMVSLASASHRSSLAWMDGMHGNGPCCDDYDCTEVTIALLHQGPNQSIVLVGDTELTLPSSWVHPTKDGRGYWCFRAQGKTYRDHDGITRGVPPATPTRQNTRCVFFHSSG